MTFNLSQFAGSLAGTVILGASVLIMGAANDAHAPGRNTLDVGRINIREADGTLRLVISNQTLAPGIIIKGHEQPHPSRQSAGMLFFNDEGSENGGLIFDGRRDASGQRHSGGSLTFDRYEQDQVVQVFGQEDGTARSAGVMVSDDPEPSMDFAAIEKSRRLPEPARTQGMIAAHAGGSQRAFFGRSADGSSEVLLKDGSGTVRLRLRVSEDGTARIEFLGQDGKVVQSLGPPT